MGKTERKKERLIERIKFLEDELVQALTKKTSTSKEINVGDHQRKIIELKTELTKLK